jgi:hypothetical protein
MYIFDGADDKQRLSVFVLRHIGSMCHVGCLVRMEGAENCAFGAVGWFGMVDAVDQQRQTKDIGEENEFLIGAVNTSDSESLEHDHAL